jgi:uncharacterized protein (DUF849 family)
MKLQACLNGGWQPGAHPALPQTPTQLALDAMNVARAGAEAIHLHVWRPGHETLDAHWIGETMRQVRAAVPGIPVGVSTGLWIVASAADRLRTIEDWTQLPARMRPDFASVNFSEEGAKEVCETLLRLGVGIEAGVESVADVERLGRSGLAGRCLRWLVEVPPEQDLADALRRCEQMHAELDALGGNTERLTHGEQDQTWALLKEAGKRGDATRIGLEDTFLFPDGTPAPDNVALVRSALQLLTAH